MELPQVDDYKRLLLEDTPLLDVRAPIEFNRGAFPFAKNYPLINNNERRDIGIRYKELGQDKAVELGHKLVNGKIKEKRVSDWVRFTQQNPQGVLYCFRGGMRSKISQQWIYEKTGVVYPRVKGGYKALRRFLNDQLDEAVQNIQPVILGGRTGVGKTLFFKRINHFIDLEHIFKHRGSVFGGRAQPQPSQVDIENELSITLLKIRNNNINTLVLEDEAANIGSRNIPLALYKLMRRSPLILLETNIDERVEIIFQEYITNALVEFQSFYSELEGFKRWSSELLNSIDKIQRRLGGKRHKEIKTIMKTAIYKHHNNNNKNHHRQWIRNLLVDYYDPMYDYQIERRSERIVFKGSTGAVLDFLKYKHGIV